MIDAIREFFDTYLRGSWTSIIDIVLVAFVIYWLFILIRGTRAVRIVIGLSILYLVYLAAQPPRPRPAAHADGDRPRWSASSRSSSSSSPSCGARSSRSAASARVNRFFVSAEVAGAERVAREISRAARILAGSRHGALIVARARDRAPGPGHGVGRADPRRPARRAAGHDLLPRHRAPRRRGGHLRRADHRGRRPPAAEPERRSTRERYGTRHRAAIGISEQTDAVVVVVSEETGSISLVVRGRIERNLTEDQLRRRIFNLIRPQAPRRAVPFLRRSIDGRWHLGGAERRGCRRADRSRRARRARPPTDPSLRR